MGYAIINNRGSRKIYLTGVESTKQTVWTHDALGKPARARQDPDRKVGKETVAHYTEDVSEAKRFYKRERAERMIADYSVLKFCQVEKI